MNSKWTNKWKKCLIWFSGYMSIVAFAIVGGYAIVKTDDEDLKKTTKVALIVSLIFAAVSGLLTIFYNFISMSNSYYNSLAYDFYNIFTKIVNVAKVVVFAIFIIVELARKEKVETRETVPATEVVK